MSELVSFVTEDGVEIVADWYPSAGDRFALLLHMMPATKESWRTFAERLVASGFSCLAIDLRGHGESNMSGALHYRTFTDAEHQASRCDVDAAFAWLEGKGAAPASTVLVGASIGANLAVTFAAARGIPRTVALSPGINYHGVRPGDSVRSLTESQRVFLVASDDDPESAEGSGVLHALNPSRAPLLLRHGLGHGTRMLEKDPELTDELIALL